MGSAAIRGWQQATGAYLALIDGDGQHPVENLSRLYCKITGDATASGDNAIATNVAATGDSAVVTNSGTPAVSDAVAADIAIASRHTDGGSTGQWSALRKTASFGAHLYGRIILPEVLKTVTDPMSGCFVVRRAAIANVALKPQGFKILLEILAMGRITSVTEIGYTFRARNSGQSKATLGQGVRYVAQVGRLRWRRWFTHKK